MTDEQQPEVEAVGPEGYSDDELLMMFHDGELDSEMHAEVQARLQLSDEAADKLASMQFVGQMVREQIDADPRGDGIVGAVMSQIAEGADESMTPIGQAPKAITAASPSNDNGRRIFGLAAFAAAAALALFMWGGQSAPLPVADLSVPSSSSEAGQPVGASLANEAATKRPEAPRAEIEEYEPTVEIASVDFGSDNGSVFYVPSDEPGYATTVVWVSSLDEEEEL